MDMRTKAAGAVVMAIATVATAHAQSVYRCGDTYSQQPCAGARAIESPHQPSAGERAGAKAAARRDAALAGTMEKERLRQEAQASSAYIPAPRLDTEPAPQRQGPDKSATRRLDMFTAVAPNSKPQADAKAGKPKGKAKKETQEAQDAKPAARRFQAQSPVRSTNVGAQPPAR